MKDTSVTKFAIAAVVVAVAIYGLLSYVAIHFIRKFW